MSRLQLLLKRGGGGTPTPTPATKLAPGPLWDGTAGSGFDGSPPVDPERTTAKPTGNLVNEPNLIAFDEDKLLVISATSGGLASGNVFGVNRVEFVLEGGDPVTITEETNHAWPDVHENECFWHGFVTEIDHAACMAVTDSGRVHWYATIYPNDDTMQELVLGPFEFLPRETMFNREITVDPDQPQAGTNFQTIQAAINNITANATERGRITVKKSGTYTIPNLHGIASRNTTTSWTVIDHDPGLDIIINSAVANLRLGVSGLWWKGAGFTFQRNDTFQSYMTESGTDGQNGYVMFEGTTIAHVNGAYWLYQQAPPSVGFLARSNGSGLGTANWYTRSVLSAWSGGLTSPGTNTSLFHVWYNVDGAGGDVVSRSNVVYANTVRNWNPVGYITPLASVVIEYSGAGAAATINRTAATNSSAAGNLVFVVDGVTVKTVAISNNPSSGIYTFAQLQAEIEGDATMADWTVTSIDNGPATRRLSSLMAMDAQPTGTLGPTNVKIGGGITFGGGFDVHGDYLQLVGVDQSNIHLRFLDCKGEYGSYTQFTGNADYYDVNISDFIWARGDRGDAVAAVSSNAHGFFLQRGTIVNQVLNLFGTGDNYSGIRDIYAETFTTDSGNADSILKDRLCANRGTMLSGATNSEVLVGDPAPSLLFNDPDNADYSPIENGDLEYAEGQYYGAKLPDGRWQGAPDIPVTA